MAARSRLPQTRSGARRRVTAIALAAAAMAASAAHGEVYKCAGDGGRPIYQEMPCPAGKELRNFQTDPPEITILPGNTKANGAAPPPKAQPAREANPDKPAKASGDKPRGDPAERRHLHTGMAEGEVLARVGKPDVITGQKTGKQVRWTWMPAEGDPETVTSVTLVAGIVTNVERTLVKR
jgi:uncharacterized protein DUF4124